MSEHREIVDWLEHKADRADAKARGAPSHDAKAVREYTARKHRQAASFVQQGERDAALVVSLKAMVEQSARYRALGNSMAVPCVGWILERLVRCDKALREAA